MAVAYSAAILAGGFGTRLRTVVQDKQKVIASIAGKPFLAYILRQLQEIAIESAVLCTGYLGEQVEAELGEHFGALKLAYSQESTPLGTAGAIRLAVPQLRGETVIILNGDSFCDVDLRAFIHWHELKACQASLLLTRVPDTLRYGRVNVVENGGILGFAEKGISGPGLINAGIYLIHKNLLEEIPKHTVCSLEKDIFPRWIEQGILYGYQAEVKKFIDIGTPESFAEASQIFQTMYPDRGDVR